MRQFGKKKKDIVAAIPAHTSYYKRERKKKVIPEKIFLLSLSDFMCCADSIITCMHSNLRILCMSFNFFFFYSGSCVPSVGSKHKEGWERKRERDDSAPPLSFFNMFHLFSPQLLLY